MKIPFVGPSYQARSRNADDQRALNCYLEMDDASPRAPLALYGMPGTVLRYTLPTAPNRGAIQQGAYHYVVAGNSVYRVATDYTATLLGVIATSAGRLGMASNGTEVLIVDGINGWLATESGFAQITDVDFPNGVTSAAFQDGFFIVTGDGSGRFYYNETPNVGSAWNGADFATAEGSPDNTVSVISDHQELWFFGAKTTEIWVNSGDADLPFQRSGNTFIEQGCAAPFTAASMNNTTYWLGASEQGQGIVFRAQGYSPIRISNHALEKAIQGYGIISDAFAYTFEMQGHSFYVLTFPSANATWFFDASTEMWFEWSWRNPADDSDNRHRSNWHVFINGEHLVGDFESGAVYALDLEAYTDNGDTIRFLRRCQTLADTSGEYSEMFFEELIIDMERGVGTATGQGSDPQLMLRYFDFDRNRWSQIRTKSIGPAGVGNRVKFGPMGSGRDRLWEISITDPVKRAVFGAMARITKGV